MHAIDSGNYFRQSLPFGGPIPVSAAFVTTRLLRNKTYPLSLPLGVHVRNCTKNLLKLSSKVTIVSIVLCGS